MLLSNLIASHQESYADIQARIEELQEQQRKIQAYLQQLGSVESQMVSAVQMLQEAIFSINEVCPDQLAEYQQTVAGLFSSPVAMLESSQPEPQPEPTPNPEPEQPSNVVQFPSNATVDVEPTVTEDDVTAELIKEILDKTDLMDWNGYRKFVKLYQLPEGIHQQKRPKVREVFVRYLESIGAGDLRGMIAAIEKV